MFFLLFVAFIADGQEFKVIRDTTDYVLKEVDSGYYYTHGVDAKNDFVIDSNIIKKKNGKFSLPLDNGKLWDLPSSFYNRKYSLTISDFYLGENKKIDYYLIKQDAGKLNEYWLVNKKAAKFKSKDERCEVFHSYPIFSPSNMLYGNVLDYSWNKEGCVEVWSLQNPDVIFSTKKWIWIRVPNEYTNSFKWIDDTKFLFSTNLYNREKQKYTNGKYYLIQIKK